MNFPSHSTSVIIHKSSLPYLDQSLVCDISAPTSSLSVFRFNQSLNQSLFTPNPSIFIAVSPVGNCSNFIPSFDAWEISSRIIRKCAVGSLYCFSIFNSFSLFSINLCVSHFSRTSVFQNLSITASSLSHISVIALFFIDSPSNLHLWYRSLCTSIMRLVLLSSMSSTLVCPK